MIDHTHIQKKGSILLVLATFMALVFSNTTDFFGLQIAHYFEKVIESKIHFFQIMHWDISWSLEHFVNDGLMVVFFYYVSLEIKYEMVAGSLSSRKLIALPLIAAVGGMVMPALIYLLFNYHNALHVPGWGIPIATDIAFSLALTSILVPKRFKAIFVFLLALAVFDDIGAILLIAIYYTKEINYAMVLFSLSLLSFLVWLNLFQVARLRWYYGIGLLLWFCLIKAGIHPTVSGVSLALIQPFATYESRQQSMAIYNRLTPLVYYFILPIFALVNAGVHLGHVSMEHLFHPILMGIVFGLTIGKPVGIAFFSYLGCRLGIAKLPKGLTYKKILAIGFICGIGFTMSLFIGTLAFHHTSGSIGFDQTHEFPVYVRLGVMAGSLLSAIFGFILFKMIKGGGHYED